MSSNSICHLSALVFVLLLSHITTPIDGSSRSRMENGALLAFEHGVRMREFGACRTPRPQVVYVTASDPSKIYLPRATLLHRCSDLTGCCPHASQACRPLSSESVELYFFTLTLKVNHRRHHHGGGSGMRQHQRIEKMSFTNHTRCGCRQRNAVDDIDAADDSLNEI